MLVVAAFDDPDAANRALEAARARFAAELFTREPFLEQDAAIERRVRHGAAIGALLGAAIAIAVQWWSATAAYPLDVGGRSGATLLSYLPPAIAVAMFWSALGAMAVFLRGADLPRLHHPLFDAALHRRIAEDAALLGMKVAEADVAAARTLAIEHGAEAVEVVGR